MDREKMDWLQRRRYPPSPFDDSAIERVRRMGLLMADDRPDRDAVNVLCGVYAGQLFDDLCDFCQNMDDVKTTITQFLALADHADTKQRFLEICLLYDSIYCQLPDPVWWISGNEGLAELFSTGFVSRMQQLLHASGEEAEV